MGIFDEVSHLSSLTFSDLKTSVVEWQVLCASNALLLDKALKLVPVGVGGGKGDEGVWTVYL